mmetsp:Transcript_3931/g.12823  ORF Transcript_3931/g.12823 Transcript_3931/m.12823 type:complete len:108 (-) Transcript_3931:1017-1340(-)
MSSTARPANRASKSLDGRRPPLAELSRNNGLQHGKRELADGGKRKARGRSCPASTNDELVSRRQRTKTLRDCPKECKGRPQCPPRAPPERASNPGKSDPENGRLPKK